MAEQGFVDVQVNGRLGIDFSQMGLTLDDVRKVTSSLVERGTIAYCPTIYTGYTPALEMHRQNLGVLAQAIRDSELSPHILGIHVEGPFISPEPGAIGAHQKEFVRDPSIEDFDRFQEWSEGNVAILTLAPERPGAEDLIRYASRQGVKVMLGHHLSDDLSMEKAVDAGAKGSTHLGNGLPNEIHRHHNPLWWQLACDDLWGTFVTDGHHLPADFIKVALRAKTVDRFIVTSDAAPLAGMPPGIYDSIGLQVEIEPSGRISCYERKYLAGSHADMLECMNHMASLGLLSEEELCKVGCHNPLKLLGRSADALDGVAGPGVRFDGRQFVVKE